MAIRKPTLRKLRALMVAIGADTDQVTRNLTQAWIRSWDEFANGWRQAMDDAASYAARTGSWPSAWELGRIERLGKAMEESERALEQLSKRAGVTISDGSQRVVALDAAAEPDIVSSQMPAGETIAVADRFRAGVTPTALNMIVARSQAQIVSNLAPLSAQAADAMRRELVRGIAVGTNPNEAASRMVARVEGAFNGGLTRAINVARTEMLDAYRSASAYQHGANSDVVGSWVWLSTLDGRTCPSCWSMHGRAFPLSLPGPLDHQQGRCARAPKTKSWRELGFDIDEPEDDIPDAEAKFWALPADQRKAIMGPGRLGLLQSGRVTWDDLPAVRPSTGWRPSYGPRTVADLQRIAGLRAAGQRPPGMPRAFTAPGPGLAVPIGPPTGSTVRPLLAEAGTIRRIEQAFVDEAERITGGRTIAADFAGMSKDTAREHAEGVLRGLERFPQVKVQLTQMYSEGGSYAETVGNWISFNQYYTSPAARNRYVSSLAADAADGYHPRGASDAIGIAVHEFGHAVAFQYGNAAIRLEVGNLAADMARRAGVPLERFITDQVSRYATRHTDELVGETVADVVMNGDRASDLSRRIYTILVKHYNDGPKPWFTVATPKATQSANAARRAAARARNKEIERRAGIADTIADFDEVLGKSTGRTPDKVLPLLRQRLDASTVDAATKKVLERALATGELPKIRAALGRLRRKYDLTPINRGGQVVKYDDAVHDPVGRTPDDGAKVVVLRQGHVLDMDADPVVLAKAKVSTAKAPAKKTPPKQAAPKPTGSKYHTTVDGELVDIARLVRQRPAQVQVLGGGYSGKVELLTYRDGSQLVRKVYDRRSIGLRESLKENADAEQLAALVMKAVGIDTPIVYRTNPTTIYMRFVPGKTGAEIVAWGDVVPDAILASDQGRLIGLGDVIMGHGDRNPGNWIRTPDDALVAIDHGFAFMWAGTLRGNPFVWHFVDADGTLSPNDMTRADMAKIRTRLAGLEDDFSKLGKRRWHERVMTLVDQLTRVANGNRNRIG